MMRASSPGAFVLSATLHAAVVAALVGAALFVAKPVVDSTPLVLVPDGGFIFSGPRREESARDAAAPVVRVTLPRHTPLVLPQPEPVATPVARPAPRPSPRNSVATVAPRPSSDRNFSPQSSTTRSSSRSVGDPVPQVDASGIVDALTHAATPGPSSVRSGPAAEAALGSYFDRLRAALRAACQLPASAQERYVTSVQFDLSADGTLSGVRVVQSSGDADYDQSVLAAFARLSSLGAVPDGRGGRYTIAFRITE